MQTLASTRRVSSLVGSLRERGTAKADLFALALPLAAALLLLRHLARGVQWKPLFVDEVLTGLISARPLPEVIDVVMGDRGGAPLHFVLAHVALALEPTPEALRWLSVVFALATVAVTYDLGRRLAGHGAGVTAAVVAATSSMLGVYGSMGRMYALFALASAVAADLFVRALQERTAGAAFTAALGVWLLPAVHPYGAIPAAAAAVVALAVWRGRPLRPALPVAAVGLATIPFALADLRLADRFGVGVEGETSLSSPGVAWRQLGHALAGFAGGEGWMFAFFLALGLAGLLVLVRRRPAFAAYALLALALPPVLLTLAKAGAHVIPSNLFTRHFIFGLPLWAALIGVGVARGVRDLGPAARAACLAGVAVVAVVAPPHTRDPRRFANATEEALAAPAAWLTAQVRADDVLFPYSPVFLAALPATREATALPRTSLALRAIARADFPVRAVFVSVPVEGGGLDVDDLRTRLGSGHDVQRFEHWLLVRADGPFPNAQAALNGARAVVEGVGASVGGQSSQLAAYLAGARSALCGPLRLLGDPCPGSEA